MISNFPFCCLTALVLLNLVGAKPVSNLQSLKELLGEESYVPYYASEESAVGDKDRDTEKEAFAAEVLHLRDDRSSSALIEVAPLLSDIKTTPKRLWGRIKKGGMRTCFGVPLDRIGSLSGVGC
ncbi:hypothetical protein DPEC_G00007810 [Dallia pectoralis]|uniref:Uncharacterized protein n=1 Tax=Dallia pectoralis TaxID=75939 RepID=A0ACC2HKH4_DALPE|nr:hypothetical protein DPEC_G00007810 [Dallia pectoralis]